MDDQTRCRKHFLSSILEIAIGIIGSLYQVRLSFSGGETWISIAVLCGKLAKTDCQ